MPQDFPAAIYGLTNPFDTEERKAFRRCRSVYVWRGRRARSARRQEHFFRPDPKAGA